MIDNLYLQQLIDYNKERKYCFKNGIININEDINFERTLKARYNKISRVKRRFLYLILNYKNLYFLTFTFNDKYLKLCERTQRDLIKNTLLDFDDDLKMILNVDYGSKNNRLHYHAIVGTNSDLNIKNYLDLVYPSFTYTLPIRLSKDDFARTSKYINKLANHCLKDSTQRRRIYYNFKGFDMLCPTSRDITIAYKMNYFNLFG